MKMIFILLLAPVFGYSQAYIEPVPEITILRVELKKDTLFVYRHILRTHGFCLSTNQEPWEYNDREVYVVGRGREIVLVAVEAAKKRRVKIDAEEEYW